MRKRRKRMAQKDAVLNENTLCRLCSGMPVEEANAHKKYSD